MKSTGHITRPLRRLMDDSRDRCSSCGNALPRDVASYAGYSADGEPLCVGECCKTQIHELATHVYWWWESDKRVSPDAVLWRYMDFARLLALLDSGALHFARVDQFADPFEAASGSKELQPRWDEHYLAFFRHAVRTGPGRSEPPDEAEVERDSARLLKDLSASALADRQRTFVSCWHANTGESEALWRLYCPPPAAGVVLQTTAGRLSDALGALDCKIGHVQYVDFSKAFAGLHERVFAKRKSLSHEHEVRAVVQQHHAATAVGISAPVNLESLIAGVIPSPFAPAWIAPLVESTLRRYGLSPGLVRRSEVLAEPFF
jgi:hypothetical protein